MKFTLGIMKLKMFVFVKYDTFVKSRHTRESGYPGNM